MGTKAALDEVLFLFLGVVLSPLCIDDGCVCVGRIICSFGFVSEVCTCKGNGGCVTLWDLAVVLRERSTKKTEVPAGEKLGGLLHQT